MIHAHLTFDHWLARLAARGTRKVVRTFHARRPLRDDLPTRDLLSSTAGIAVVNDMLRHREPIRHRKVWFTPPPVDLEEFRPDALSARTDLGVEPGAPLFGVIGKIAPGRGFESAFEAFAAILQALPSARLVVVGEGPHRPQLERLSGSLGISEAIVWAGYHEVGLAGYYRAMDVMLFTAPGSDQGHRSVLEAMACGTPVVALPVEGLEAILGTLSSTLISPEGDATTHGAVAAKLFVEGRAAAMRQACADEVRQFGFAPAAKRLEQMYAEVMDGASPLS